MTFTEPYLQGTGVEVNVEQLESLSSGDSEPKTALHGRAYQLEMLDESMKRNIIIAAETGSGKTLMCGPLTHGKSIF